MIYFGRKADEVIITIIWQLSVWSCTRPLTHPADGVGIFAMRVGELGGTPARDGFSHELSRRHEEGKGDEHESRVLATESVSVIVV